jgi:hypothetical protein
MRCRHGGKALRRGLWIALASSILGLVPGLGEAAGAAPSAYEVDAALSQLGPRPDGSPAQGRAVELLLAAMRRAGLRDVRAVSLAPSAPGKPGQTALEGVLSGATDREIVLSGHFDTVAKSPGADDDGSGCSVAIAAAADLARTPLGHTVRVVLFNGEEEGLLGSRAWVESLDAGRRDCILADLNLEMLGWAGSPGPTLHALAVRRRTGPAAPGRARPTGALVLPPGWLVHAVLRSGDAVGWPLAMADPRFPTLMQLVQRSVRVRFGADSDAFQARGIPAVTVSDSSFLSLDPTYHKAIDVAARLDPHRMEQWTAAVAATVRRLDRLAGPPIAEDQYLVLGGRVWLRRDILMIGFVLWVALVFRGIPGRWRGASAEERLRQRRRYMPGFVFRILLLFALFAAPVLSVLLLPAAVLALAPPRRIGLRLLWAVLGLLPLGVYLFALVDGVFAGVVSTRGGFTGGLPALLLITGTFAAYAVMIAVRTPPPESSAASSSPGAPGS